MDDQRLTMFVHGDSGAGKSWLANTAPGPRLYLDAEGRAGLLADTLSDPTGMTRQRRVLWDPTGPPPEESADPNVVTVVNVDSFRVVQTVYSWLVAGDLPFESVIIDSVTELQQRLIDSVAGSNQLQIQDWGTVLRDLEGVIRKYRDLRTNPKHPLWAVIIVGGSKEKNNKQRALLQGQLADKIAYHFDVVGYLSKQKDEAGGKHRVLDIDGYTGTFEAKDNTHRLSAFYGERIVDPNISDMLRVMNADNPTNNQEGNNP